MSDPKGLYAKYRITKADGTPVDDRCFILKPDKDPAAVKALQAYAAATDDEQLRSDLYAWVGKPAPIKNVMFLPCNIGDTVYVVFFIKDGTGSHINEYTCSGIHIADKVTRWRSEKAVRYMTLRTDDGHSIKIRMEELGKTLFMTRKGAEAALKNGRHKK